MALVRQLWLAKTNFEADALPRGPHCEKCVIRLKRTNPFVQSSAGSSDAIARKSGVKTAEAVDSDFGSAKINIGGNLIADCIRR
jgi:hypothetical protein